MRFTDQSRRDLCRSVAECYTRSEGVEIDPIKIQTGSKLLVAGVMIKYLEEAILDRLEMSTDYSDRNRSFLDQFVMESVTEITDQISDALTGLLPLIMDGDEARLIIEDCYRIEQTAHGI